MTECAHSLFGGSLTIDAEAYIKSGVNDTLSSFSSSTKNILKIVDSGIH